MLRLLAALGMLSLAGAAAADDKDTKTTIIGTWQWSYSGTFFGGGWVAFEFQEQSLKIRNTSGFLGMDETAAKITVGKDGTVVGKVTNVKGSGKNLKVDQEFRFKWEVKPNGDMVLSGLRPLGYPDTTYKSTTRWRVSHSTSLQAAEVNLGGADPATRRLAAETIRGYRQMDAVAIRHAFGVDLPWNAPSEPQREMDANAVRRPEINVLDTYCLSYMLVVRPVLYPLSGFRPDLLVPDFEKMIGKPLPPQVMADPLPPRVTDLPVSKQLDLKRTSPDAGSRAAWALYAGAIGKDDATFLAPLIELLGKDANPYVRVEAAHALGRIGPAAVPALTDALASADPRVRFAVATALTRIDPTKPAAVDLGTLIAVLDSDDTSTHAAASEMVGRLGPAGKAAAPQLHTILMGLDRSLVEPVAKALVAVDPDRVPAAAEALGKVLVGARGERAHSAMAALAAFGGAGLPGLRTALKTGDADVQSLAVPALGSIRPEALPDLVGVLKEGTAKNRALAAKTLAPFGADAVPSLAAALGDKDPAVRQAGIEALGRVGPAAREAIPALAPFLTDKDPATRLLGVEALTKLGAGPELVAVVAKATGGAAVRAAAARGLGELGAGAADGVSVLLTALDDREKAVAVAASAALVKLGPVAVPELEKALVHKDYIVRARAATVLGGIGPDAKSAVPALTANLTHAEWKTRRAAADALGKVGVAAKDAVGPLTAALRDKDSAVREAAATALGTVGPAAKSAIPALKAATADTYASVAAAAKATLGKLEP